LFGQFDAQFYKIEGFLTVGRLQHGNLGKPGIVSGILFVLRRMHPRIIGYDNHHAAFNPQITKGH
jgi:hypothetical protein